MCIELNSEYCRNGPFYLVSTHFLKIASFIHFRYRRNEGAQKEPITNSVCVNGAEWRNFVFVFCFIPYTNAGIDLKIYI